MPLSPFALPGFLAHQVWRRQSVTPASPSRPPPMTWTEILTRYRGLRQISKELHQAVLDVVAPKVVLDRAKRLGLARGRTVLLESEQGMILAEDLAI